MLMPCGYLERTRPIRLLRPLEISTCSRAGARTDLRDRRWTVFPWEMNRGYNRVCRNGPRSRPSQPMRARLKDVTGIFVEAWFGPKSAAPRSGVFEGLNQIKSNQIKPNQTKPNQSDQIKSNQIKSNQINLI